MACGRVHGLAARAAVAGRGGGGRRGAGRGAGLGARRLHGPAGGPGEMCFCSACHFFIFFLAYRLHCYKKKSIQANNPDPG